MLQTPLYTVEPLPGNGRLKLLHNLYNHGMAPIVQRG